MNRSPLRPRHALARAALLLPLALAFAAREAPAQELHGQDAATDAQREMLELFKKVERRLREVHARLVDAGAGDTSRLAGVGAAGIDELLERALDQGRQNQRDIDRIIELAQQFGQQQRDTGSSGPGGQPQQDGQSPLDRGGSMTQREATPEAPEPGGEPSSEQPGSEGEEPGSEEEQGRAREPRHPGEAPDADPENREGDDPPGGPTDRSPVGPDTSERWGELPIKVRDVFRQEGAGDLPPQYRDWIDAYYRRLAREGGR